MSSSDVWIFFEQKNIRIKAIVCPKAISRLFIAGSWRAKYTFPMNLNTKVAPTKQTAVVMIKGKLGIKLLFTFNKVYGFIK